MGQAQLLTQSAYARHRGVDPTSVRDAIRAGRITPVMVGGKPMIDKLVADAQWQANTRVRMGVSQPPKSDAGGDTPDDGGSGGDYWESRARREAAEAELAELKLAEQRGDLVRAGDVRAAQAKLAAGLREALLQIPARLAAVLAAETDQARCHDHLQDELHQVLAQVAAA